jgi:two-component system chemotaxis response regulator CheB
MDEVEWSMQALRAGALTALKKPSGPGSPDFVPLCKEIVHTVKAMAGIYVIRHRRMPERTRGPRHQPRLDFDNAPSPLRAVAIAASTGGPPALATVLGGLSQNFSAPILLVQHIVPSFVEGFAHWLDSVVDVKVKLASDQERAEPGTVYVAPPDRHLGMCSPTRLELSDKPEIDGFRPAASYLFESLANSVGGDVAAVIMTGMGSDGVTGLQRLHDGGGYTIAQDEQSCIVFGMPQAAIRAGAIDATLPLQQIAVALEELARGKRRTAGTNS